MEGFQLNWVKPKWYFGLLIKCIHTKRERDNYKNKKCINTIKYRWLNRAATVHCSKFLFKNIT